MKVKTKKRFCLDAVRPARVLLVPLLAALGLRDVRRARALLVRDLRLKGVCLGVEATEQDGSGGGRLSFLLCVRNPCVRNSCVRNSNQTLHFLRVARATRNQTYFVCASRARRAINP